MLILTPYVSIVKYMSCTGIRLNQGVLAECEFWVKLLRYSNFYSVIRQFRSSEATLWSDASGDGMGAYLSVDGKHYYWMLPTPMEAQRSIIAYRELAW